MSFDIEALREPVRLLRQRIIAMTGRPVQVVLTRHEETAATDCERTVLFNPRPFLLGLHRVGMGIGTHEAGHICHSPFGRELMAAAHKEGEQALATIVNLLLDRKDDFLTRENFPGARADLNARMSYVMPSVEEWRRRKNPFVDFFYACKGFSRPRLPVVWECMKLVNRIMRDFRKVGKDEILVCAREVRVLLGDACPQNDTTRRVWMSQLVMLLTKMSEREQDSDNPLSPAQQEALTKLIAQVEAEEDAAVFPDTQDERDRREPKTGEVGSRGQTPKEFDVPEDPATFAIVRRSIEHLVAPLREILECTAPPVFVTLRGLDEGQVDSTRLTGLILGQTDVLKRREVRRDDTVSLTLSLDCSSSMGSGVEELGRGTAKIEYGRQLGVLFNAALEGLPNTTTGCWAFNNSLQWCGPASSNSGVANRTSSGGNCDSVMAARLIPFFRANEADRMVAIFVSDGGPDSFDKLSEQIQILRGMGVCTVQFFIESSRYHHSDAMSRLRSIFDYQVVFDSGSIDSMVNEFGHLLQQLYERR